MALIGEIRRRSWILIVMIALGLGGFLVMDMVNANQGPGGVSQQSIGSINGKEIDQRAYNIKYSIKYNRSAASQYQNRAALWQWYVEDHLISEEAEALGLTLSDAEIRELEFGANPSPIVRNFFPNPQQPGTVDRQTLSAIQPIIESGNYDDLQNIGYDPQSFLNFWKMQRKEIVKERLQSKLSNMVSKGMYTPSWMAEMGFAEQNQFIDFAFVKVPYGDIPNDQISIADSDLEDYLTANSKRYMRDEELRRIDYVSFDVVATAADSAALRDEISALIPDFQTAENDSNFVLKNEGQISPFYLSDDELGRSSQIAADTLFGMAPGTVFGPYVENGNYNLVKLLDRQVMADSADTRHILISAPTPDAFAAASVRADSMLNVLRSGAAEFDSLAIKFSQDPGSASNGGLYEGVTPNQFVPEFNRVLFITGEIGQLYKVRTSYGYHIVEVLSRTSATTERVQVAFISEGIVPSKETQDNAFQRASQFIANNRDLTSMISSADQASDLRAATSPAFDINAFSIPQLGSDNEVRDIVCWAFSADEGDVSPEVFSFSDKVRYYDNKYVVIGLRDVQEPGLPDVADIRDELELEVTKQLKGEAVSGQISSTDLNALATQFSVSVDTASNVSFSQASNPQLGAEPKVVAKAFSMEEGQTSGPIVGEDGVFVIQLIRKPTLGQATNIPQIRQRMNNSARVQVPGSLVRFMAESADVNDNRASFDCRQ